MLFYLSIGVASSCASFQYESEPIDNDQLAADFLARDLDSQGLKHYLEQNKYLIGQWPMDVWDINSLALAAFYYNPGLQVAVEEYNKSAVHSELIKNRINPGISIPLEYHSETEGGKSPWSTGLIFQIIYERHAKTMARIDQAKAGLDVARYDIKMTAWKIYSELHREYINYLAAMKNRELLTKQKILAEQNIKFIQRRLELGQASDFELSSMRLELQRIKLAITRQGMVEVESRHALANNIGIPVSAIEKIRLSDDLTNYFLNLEKLDQTEIQGIALTRRLDIQKALSEYAVQEATVKLEIEKQYPDINLSPGFIFDQNDNIWQLGIAWILPLLHPQNEGPIKEAMAIRKIKQAEFLVLQSQVINEISSSFDRLEIQYQSLEDAYQLLDETRKRFEQIERQYDAGYADHLQLSRTQQELASIEQSVAEIKYSVIKSAVFLEEKLQYPLFSNQDYDYFDRVNN